MSGERHFLRVENFDAMQNPKRPKKPTWIKSYTGDLDDPEYLNLSIFCRGFLADFQKLAATMGNRVPYDPAFIARKLGINGRHCGHFILTLQSHGFLSCFVEGTKTSRKNDLAQKIATPSIPCSPSPSNSVSISNSDLSTGTDITTVLDTKSATSEKNVVARFRNGKDTA